MAPQGGRFSRIAIHDHDSFHLPLFTKVQLQRRSGVTGWRGRGQILRSMQVAQCDVVCRGRKSLRRYRVRFRDMNLTLAAAGKRSIDEEVGEENVNGLDRKS